MQQQNRILETVSSPEGLTRVSALMSAESFSHRTAVADRVCKAFGFSDARGRQQRAGCLKALRALDAKGCIALPAPRHRGGGGQPRGLGQAVAAPSGVPDRVNEVEDLVLILVSSAEQRRVWNELMAREHPQGAARHVGAQVRYLILSRHGCLGAFGFAASALMLVARDRWIGWDPALRAQQLHRVVAMSRFLIRPGVRCHNLASKVLGMCLRRLADDFARRYGYSPLLVETFVDSSCHAGTSLKASNWILVGETCGRGRFAPAGVQVPVKSIYMYPLQPAWREQLGLATRQPIPALGPGEGLDRAQWAEQEFGGAPLGDVRLSRRLVKSVTVQADAPMASFPSAAQSDKALVRGYYRLIDQPDDSQLTPENILAPHRARTLGLHMHSTLVVNGAGLPLGVPHIQYEAPDGQAEKNKPLEQRKTNRWLRGLQQFAEFADQLDGVRPVAVMDREADVFDLFAEQHRLGTVDLLVRAKHNRSLGKDLPKLFEAVQAKPVQAHLEMHVARSSARRAIASAEQELLPGSGTASAQPRACLRRVGARQPRATGMVPVDLLAGDIQAAGPQNPRMVSPALAHRRLAPRAQVRLQGRISRPSHRRAD